MINVSLLGCGGMMPLPNRYLTSMIISYNGKMILVDCGEGTQVSLKILKWGFKAIESICFTHYHADHIAGIPGLLLTIGNSGRTEPLTIIGPKGLLEVIKGLTIISPNLPFELRLLEIPSEEEIVERVGDFYVHTIGVDHTIPCIAYTIEIKRKRKFDPDRAKNQNIPMFLWNRLHKGEKVIFEGKIFTPDMVLGEERKGLKISYCTDTRPTERLVDFINEADLFICEGMYGEYESIDKAMANKHMLFSEAALLAKKGNVKELWLTHYSPALKNPMLFLEGTRNIFKNTLLGEDRMSKVLCFE
ncbi:ribonuclease Z [Tepidibacter formicigenes]|jgi:ribonuclease Z|uniref:Ribonuclease Z n=1 Tax=Tepidibacter formicigenes DSM 15518 TaxID=1123349 RepID=A0A1M6SXG3_9FIRM|nr:ribonuclease Z [Tepidibacter formicigenes]SHK49258.1 ribonuclease Z [Tepidibacter formicigenes DSM 15518]